MLSSLERIISPKSYKIRLELLDLLQMAKSFGLPEQDCNNAQEMLANNEAGEALDIMLVQLYEYSIPVNEEFLNRSRNMCRSVGIEWDEYAVVAELRK